MELKSTTTAREIYDSLGKDIRSYLPEESSLQEFCLATALRLAGIRITKTDDDGLLWRKGVRIFDVFDDRKTPDEAIKFYLKSEKVEAHLLWRIDNTVSLEINDVGNAQYQEEGYQNQRLRLIGGDTTRRLAADDHSYEVAMKLLMDTKW